MAKSKWTVRGGSLTKTRYAIVFRNGEPICDAWVDKAGKPSGIEFTERHGKNARTRDKAVDVLVDHLLRLDIARGVA